MMMMITPLRTIIWMCLWVTAALFFLSRFCFMKDADPDPQHPRSTGHLPPQSAGAVYLPGVAAISMECPGRTGFPARVTGKWGSSRALESSARGGPDFPLTSAGTRASAGSRSGLG